MQTPPRSAPGGGIDGSEEGERRDPRRALPRHMGASEARVLGSSFPRIAGDSASLPTGASGHQSGSGPETIALVCKALAQRWVG
jgi:hypothetical protein